MATITNPVLPKGSTVLVTGANGFLGSHIADQFLRNGYKVRGAVRDPSKTSWAVDIFGKLYGKENFELVAVPDMSVEGAFDEAVKGVGVVVHTAAFLNFVNEADKVVPITVAGALNVIKTAYSEPSVKRFVLTSSMAAAMSIVDDGVTVTEESWNEAAVTAAWAPPPYEPYRPALVYEASKTQSEQEVWKFHRENRSKRPDLVLNTVLPCTVFGRCIDPVSQGYRSSGQSLVKLWHNKKTVFHEMVRGEYFVNAEDMALLHVAGGLLPHVQDQRIFAFGDRFCWDAVLDIMRELDRGRELPENFSGGETRNEVPPRAKAEKLLQELGRPGWTSLADSVAANVKDA